MDARIVTSDEVWRIESEVMELKFMRLYYNCRASRVCVCVCVFALIREMSI